MRVISYVYGILTVIRGDDMYRDYTSKPEFISGSTFYYEPTLKQTDGRELTTTEIEDANKFIDSFEFIKADINVDVYAHCVDNDGNYLGYIVNNSKYREVLIDLDDDISNKYYDGTSFVDRLLVNKDTNYYSGIGDTRTALNTYYAPNTIGDTPFSLSYYFYNKDLLLWDISLEDAKTCKINGLMAKQQAEVTEFLGTLAFGEMSSFLKQADEALAWEKDNSLATPFIDKILISRNLGEDRETFLALVLYKSKLFEDFYATNLGKFQGLMKLVDRVVSIDEVKSIVW